ncbi:MAG TPA: peroxiredoxin [Prolixibacteraceae bacterium]|nr:peroxiredoxin [Prolixibacteraceae bacterium]
MKALFVLTSIILASLATTDQTGLKKGDIAPMFSAKSHDGSDWTLSDYIGKKNVILYFYPAAMTGGCTAQACSYRDHIADLEKLDAIVVGVSGDDQEALKVFRKAHDLNFTLLSDFSGSIAAMYGVPTGDGGSISRVVGEQEFILNRGVTAQRWTFIIGKDGRVAYMNNQVDAANDYKAVLENLAVK